MKFAFVMHVLYRKIWIIICVPMISGAVAYYLSLDVEKKFKSTAQLSADQITKASLHAKEPAPNFEGLIEIMKTELMCSMLSYNLLLHDLAQETPFRRIVNSPLSVNEYDSVRAVLNAKLISFEMLSPYNEFERSIIELLEGMDYKASTWISEGDLSIDREGRTNFIRVQFLSENPFLSAFVVNRLCEEYIRYHNSLARAVSEDSLQVLAKELEQKEKYLKEKTEQLSNVKRVSQHEVDSKPAMLAEYERRLREANKLMDLEKNLRTAISDHSKLPKAGSTVSNPKLVALHNKVSELNKIYVEGGSQDRELATTLQRLREQVEAETIRLSVEAAKEDEELKDLKEELKRTQMAYRQAESNCRLLRAKIGSLNKRSSIAATNNPAMDSFKRERDMALEDFTNAAHAFNEAKSEVSETNPELKLMIRGQASPEPETSEATWLITISVVISCIFAVCAIALFAYYQAPRRPFTPTFVITRTELSRERGT